jgi:hypothetical protein
VTANASRRFLVSRAALLALLLSSGLVLAACTKAEQKASDASTTSSGASSAPATSVTPTPKPTPKVPTSFDGACDSLLPVSSVDIAVGRPIIGTTAFIVGVAEPDIGRTAYLNCRYGISTTTKAKKKVTTTQVEVGLSLYKTSAQAAARVQSTVESYRDAGATQLKTNVGTSVGTLLVGNGDPTLVVANGIRTVAVTMSSKVVGLVKTQAATAKIAEAALDATNESVGITGSASSTASASATSS